MFYDRFLELCTEKGVKPTNACIEAGLSRGLAAKWKSTGTEKPSADALEKISEYFNKSIDEILDKEKTPTLTEKDERDDGNVNLIKIAGRDGSYTEKRVSDEQLALFQSMLSQMKPVDDDV